MAVNQPNWPELLARRLLEVRKAGCPHAPFLGATYAPMLHASAVQRLRGSNPNFTRTRHDLHGPRSARRRRHRLGIGQIAPSGPSTIPGKEGLR